MRIWERLICNIWKTGGAKQISFDAVIPIIALPILAVISAQSLICTFLVFLTTPILVCYLNHNFLRFVQRTKFFFVWTISSGLMLMFIFEWNIVPLLEILPEENAVFIFSVVAGLFCGFKTRLNADQAIQDDQYLEESLELGEDVDILETDDGQYCTSCRKRMPPKAFHCRLCQTCIGGREYHCKWLDCCIGSSNLRWYLGCLLFSAIAFIYGSNLTMTSICHPFILIGTILMPDDCSDVYNLFDMALCFVCSVYSLILGLIVFFYLTYHLWLLYIGSTSNERRLRTVNNHSGKNSTLKSMSRILCCKS